MGAHILVDLDRTLAVYNPRIDGPYDPFRIGTPISPMVNRIRGWLDNGVEVKIFTARVSDPDPDMNVAVRAHIQKWLQEFAGLPALEVVNFKTYETLEIWDDIAVGVHPNAGYPIAERVR